MTDDQKKHDPASPDGDESPASPFRYLDRDQWYDDDERIVNDPGEQPAAVDDVEPDEVVSTTPPPEDDVIPLAAEVDETTEPDQSREALIDDDAEPVPTEPDPYDFGTPPESEPTTTPPIDDVDSEPTIRYSEKVTTAQALTGGLASMGAGWSSRVGGVFGRFTTPLEAQFAPLRSLVTTPTQRTLMVIAIALALISLLADSAGFALLVLGSVLPVLIALSVLRKDVFEKEPPLILFGVAGVGLVVGLIMSAISAWIVREQWFDSGLLNNGAAGYGGAYADRAGSAPFVVQVFAGLVLPILSLAAIIALPIYLRRYVQFRNEIMDGATLGAIGAAGYTIGASVIFFAPSIGDGLPRLQVSDWTLISVAVVIVRPMILTLSGAMLGIAIWRYMRDASIREMLLPALGGAGVWMLLMLGTIQFQPSGISLEFLWNIVLAVAAFVLYQRSVAGAVGVDRQALGNGDGRMVCPSCRQVTPVGSYCANCGAPLRD